MPRRTLLDGDPCKVVFSEKLDTFVVALHQTQLVPDSARNWLARRAIRPAIQFLDLNPSRSTYVRKNIFPLDKAGSTIRSLLSSTIIKEAQELEVIVVGLQISNDYTEHCDGLVIYLTAAKVDHGNGEIEINICRVIKLRGRPVYSLAAYDKSSFIVGAGSDLFVQRPDLSARNSTQGNRQALPSPAVSLHVSGNSVFVTTARHFLKEYEVDGMTLVLKREFTRVIDATCDARQFIGSGQGGLLTTTSNKGDKLLGLLPPGQGNFLRTFKAKFPQTISCLRKASQDTHERVYYGSTIDGSLCQFTILDMDEWKLLSFIDTIASLTSQKRSHNHPSKKRKKTLFDGYINGDTLMNLLDDGYGTFRRVLTNPPDFMQQGSQATSNQLLAQLSTLGRPLFGDSDDPVTSTFRWLQQFLGRTWR